MAESAECLLSSLDLDPERFTGDFDNYHKRMETLRPVVDEALSHLDVIGEEFFGDKKSLIVSAEDEEFIRSALELRRKPVAVVLGQVNCGKSTLLNELFRRTNLVPTSQQCCTARLVFLDYVDDYEKERWQLVLIDGTPMGDSQPLTGPPVKKKKKRKISKPTAPGKKILPTELINLGTGSPNENGNVSSREDVQAVHQIIQAHVKVNILKYGIQLVDSPGFGENKELNNLFEMLIEQDLEPLIVYVFDGNRTWSIGDCETLAKIKGRYPEASFMFVVNKIDIDKKEDGHNAATDDEDDQPKADAQPDEGKVRRLSELEPGVMNKIKDKGFLGQDEPFLTSELFHCISAKQQAAARRKGKCDISNEYVEKFQRFEACFLKKMYERMKHLEGRVMNRVITLMEAFLSLFGKQRVGFIAAVNIVPEFIDKAMRAETHLKTQFSKYVDDIIKDDVSIANTLEETKRKVKTLGREKKIEFEGLSLSSESIRSQRTTIVNLWELFEVQQIPEREDEEIQRRAKAASFAVRIFDEVLCSIPNDIIEAFEKKMTERRDRFYTFVKKLREDLEDDCLNNLFEQAYRIHNNTGEQSKELKSVKDIMSLKPVINAAQSALFDYVEEGMKAMTKEDLHLTELTNMERWRDQFIESIFNRIKAHSICGRLVRICSQKMDEMHKEFIRNINRMKHLRDEAVSLGEERLKELGKKVKPPLFLRLCEVYSVRYELEHGQGIDLGEEVGRDGHYTIHTYPHDDDLVVFVLKKADCNTDAEWMERAIDIFHAHDIMRQTDTVSKGGPHPFKSCLVNCHGVWMPDRETFHVLFEKTDETILEYVVRKQPSLKERLQLALSVGRGLQLLHLIQYVHLDLRPTNILMRGSQPKIHLCHWQSPFENIKLQSTDNTEGIEVPPFHLHKNFQNHYERTDTTCDLDRYAFGTFLWMICEGSFAAYPENYRHCTSYAELLNTFDNGIIPEQPAGKMVTELDQHQTKLYELMKQLWMQPETYTMEIANDRLAFMTGQRDSGTFSSFFDLEEKFQTFKTN